MSKTAPPPLTTRQTISMTADDRRRLRMEALARDVPHGVLGRALLIACLEAIETDPALRVRVDAVLETERQRYRGRDS